MANIYVTTLPLVSGGVDPTAIYVDGVPAVLARTPDSNWFTMTEVTTTSFRDVSTNAKPNK